LQPCYLLFCLDPDLHQGRLQKVTKKVKAAEKRLKFSSLHYNEEAYNER